MNHRLVEIKNFIIERVIETTQSNNQIIDYIEVENEFGRLDIEDTFTIDRILSHDYRVADCILNEDGFDVIIYDDYL